MSYVLKFWESPIPTTMEEALAIEHQLHDQNGPENPKFPELVKRMKSGDTYVAADRRPIYALGISTDALTPMHKRAIRVAKELALVMMDEQAGEVFLPNGTVLRMPHLAAPDESKPENYPLSKLVPVRIPADQPYVLHVMLDRSHTIGALAHHVKKEQASPPSTVDKCDRFRMSWFHNMLAWLNERGSEELWFTPGPLRGEIAGQLMTLQLHADRIEEGRALVRHAASYKGFTVFDPQAKQAFYADGGFVVTEGLYSIWPNNYAEYPKRRAGEIVTRIAAECLAAHGYASTGKTSYDVSLKRKFKGGEHSLVLTFDGGYPACEIQAFVNIKLKPSAKLGKEIQLVQWNDKAVYLRYPLQQFLPPAEFIGILRQKEVNVSAYGNWGAIAAYTDEHAELAANWWAEHFLEYAHPLLLECETFEGFNRFVNGEGAVIEPHPAFRLDPNTFPTAQPLLLAHYAKDPRFAQLREAVEQYYVRFPKATRREHIDHILAAYEATQRA